MKKAVKSSRRPIKSSDDKVYSYSFDYIITGNDTVNDVEDRILRELELIDGIELVGNPGINNTSWTKEEYGINSSRRLVKSGRNPYKRVEVRSPKGDIVWQGDNIALARDFARSQGCYYQKMYSIFVNDDFWEEVPFRKKSVESSRRPVKSSYYLAYYGTSGDGYVSYDNEPTNDFDEAMMFEDEEEAEEAKRLLQDEWDSELRVEESNIEIESGCHGGKKKPAKKKAVKSSKFNTFSSLFIKQDVIKKGKYGIELNLNGWKIINANGKPAGGEPAEFDSESEAKSSEMYQDLVLRYGEDKVRTYKQ